MDGGDGIILRSLPLTRTRVWPGNPRRTVRDVEQLAASVAEKGVLEPVLARPVEGDPAFDWEILAGQRRFLAAGVAGLTEIPALVRVIADDEALELGLVENAARTDVDPLEEAEAIDRLVREHGRSVAVVAARLGRTPRWVDRRRMLLNLAPESRVWALRLCLPLAHMEALAAVGTDTQARVVARMGHAKDPKDVPTLARFAQEITWELHLLSGAPFPLDDAKLGGRGRCEGCAYRSDRQGDLFGGVPGGAHCLDRVCWDAKVDALWERAKRRKLDVLDAGTVSHGVDYGTGLYLRSDVPYVAAPPTKDAKPVAVVRGARGHVYELFAKPAPDEGADTDEGADPDDEEGDTPAGRRRETDEDNVVEKRRVEREAADVARLRKLYDLARDPRRAPAVARVALYSALCDDGALSLKRLRGGPHAELAVYGSQPEHVALIPDDELLPTLLAVLANGILGEQGDDGPGFEREVRALLDAPAVPTVRVWVAEAAWDALATEPREDLEEPIAADDPLWGRVDGEHLPPWISREQFRDACAAGVIEGAVKVGRAWTAPRGAVEAWALSGAKTAAANDDEALAEQAMREAGFEMQGGKR